jgi:hypothetical protein
MKQIYVAYTPYHLLLSCGLAAFSGGSDEKYLVVIPVYSDVDAFCRSVKEWDKNPFSKIIMINGIYDVSSRVKRVDITRNNLKIIKNFLIDAVSEACDVFIFNDGYPEAQIIARINHRRGGINTYVEDGSAAYNNSISPKIPIFKKIVYKLVYGIWYEDVSILGTYEYINKVMVIQPDFIRPELRVKEIAKIHKNIFNNLKNDGFISTLFKNYSLDWADLNLNSVLIVSHSNILSKGLSDTYRHLAGYLSHLTGGLYLKYHPREHEDDFLGIRLLSPGVKLIPKTLPLEAIFVALQDADEPVIIVGDLSTSLLTAKYLLEGSYVISIMEFSNQFDPNLENIFKKIGVFLPKDIEDLTAILKTIEEERTQL